MWLHPATDQTEDNTYTLKELGKYDSKSGKVKLFYRNESAYPEKYILAALSSIQGVAKHVIKALWHVQLLREG